MNRALRALALLAAFATSAGIGAVIAAHSNPFSPNVPSSGALTGTTEPPSGRSQRWIGTFRTSSYHELYVGGRCATDWTGRLSLRVGAGGGVSGDGSATREGALRCTFPVAQAQVRRFQLAVRGTVRDGRLLLRLSES